MKKIFLLGAAFVLLVSCVKKNDSPQSKDNFDRGLILTNWVDNIINPAYAAFETSFATFKTKQQAFNSNPNTSSLNELKTALFNLQKAWQHIAMFEFGTAEEINYRFYMNQFPVDLETKIFPVADSNEDKATILRNLEDHSYGVDKDGNETDNPSDIVKNVSVVVDVDYINNINFSLVNRANEQGFPALDYLINGVAIEKYTTDPKKENYLAYLTKVTSRMETMTTSVINYWSANSANVIANKGSNANASFDKLVNDYLNYTEQGFREIKIATPSGFRNGPSSKNEKAVESYYSSQNSKELLTEAYKAIKDFYYGASFTDNSVSGVSLDDYLISLNATAWDVDARETKNINTFIGERFTAIDAAISALDADLSEQVINDNNKMIKSFEVIQLYVILLKTNAFSSMNVQVDFVDSDGD